MGAKNDDQFAAEVQALRQRQQAWERAFTQGYVEISFSTSNWTWGTITYRWDMSGGPNGAIEFISRAEAIAQLDTALTRGVEALRRC